jgi:carbon monoxide dehydrogenase subunit G
MTASTTSATTGSTFYSACALDGRSAQQLSHLREGEGGVAGFAKGGAKVSLSDKDGGTLLTYNVEAQIGGKLAQLGQRLIAGAAKKMADDFFQKFAAAVAPPA